MKAGLLKILSKMGISLLTRYAEKMFIAAAIELVESNDLQVRERSLNVLFSCALAVITALRSLRSTVWVQKLWIWHSVEAPLASEALISTRFDLGALSISLDFIPQISLSSCCTL